MKKLLSIFVILALGVTALAGITLKGVSGHGGIARGPNLSDVNFTLSAVENDTVIVAGGSTTSVVKDGNYSTATMQTYDRLWQLQTQNANPGDFRSPVFSSRDTGNATVSSNGSVTKTSTNGASVTFDATLPWLKKAITLPVVRVIGGSQTSFTGYVSGSLGNSAANAIDSLITGLTPSSSTQNRFSAFNDTTHTYTLNGSVWSHSIDCSCIPVSNSEDVTQPGCTLISPSVGLCVNHDFFVGGTLVYFRGTDGSINATTVVNHTQIGTTDIELLQLSPSLPSTVHPAKVLPANWASYLPTMNVGLNGNYATIPCLRTNQFRQMAVGEWMSVIQNQVGVPSPNNIIVSYASALRQPWGIGAIPGDSGNGCCIVVNGSLVVLGALTTDGSGEFVSAHISDINAAIANPEIFNLSETLTQVDLSSFTAY